MTPEFPFSRILWSGLALSVLLAACADGSSVVDPTAQAPLYTGDATDPSSDPPAGELTVCKVADDPGSFSFSASETPGDNGQPQDLIESPFGLASGDCVLAWSWVADPPGPTESTTVTVTEAVPSGWQLDKIVVLSAGGLNEFTSTNEVSVGGLNEFHGAIVWFHNSLLPVVGEGCTPGFWRNERRLTIWPVDPSTLFNSVFTSSTLAGDLTFFEAVWLRGGDENALGRHAAAAYLNALSEDVDYAFSVAEIVAMVNAAFDGTADVEGTKNTLEAENQNCPL